MGRLGFWGRIGGFIEIMLQLLFILINFGGWLIMN